MTDARSSLIATATVYEEDIAMACFLHSQVAPSTPTPGDVITWICRLQPTAMLQDVDNLKALRWHLDRVDATQVQALYEGIDPGWVGPAGTAFEERWVNDLLTYVGKDGASGRRQAFEATEGMLINIAHESERLQQNCKNYIEQNLSGLREKFITACRDDAEADKLQDIGAGEDIVMGGVKLVLGGDNPVDKVGSALGLLLNAVSAFMESTVEDAQNALKVSVAGESFRIAEASDALLDSPVIGYHPYSQEHEIPYESK